MVRDYEGGIDNCFDYTSYQEDVTGPVSPPTFAEVPTAPPSSLPSGDAEVGEHAPFAWPRFPVRYFPGAYCTLRVNWVDTRY